MKLRSLLFKDPEGDLKKDVEAPKAVHKDDFKSGKIKGPVTLYKTSDKIKLLLACLCIAHSVFTLSFPVVYFLAAHSPSAAIIRNQTIVLSKTENGHEIEFNGTKVTTKLTPLSAASIRKIMNQGQEIISVNAINTHNLNATAIYELMENEMTGMENNTVSLEVKERTPEDTFEIRMKKTFVWSLTIAALFFMGLSFYTLNHFDSSGDILMVRIAHEHGRYGFKVGDVWEGVDVDAGGPAELAGLKTGDRIHFINGVRVHLLERKTFQALFLTRDRDVILVVQRFPELCDPILA